jgi:hypothetical protein
MKISQTKIFAIALVAIGIATSFNTFAVFSALAPIAFPGSSLFTITAQYQFGASPQGAVATPGGSVPFTLTLQSSARAAQTILLSFNSTDSKDWSYTTAVVNCSPTGQVPGFLTMTLANASPMAPINNSGTCPPSISGVIVTTNPGINTYTGSIAVASNAPAGLGFSINWFGTPQ